MASTKPAARGLLAKTPRRRAVARSRPVTASRPDAIAMLRADHARVADLLERFGNARGAVRKQKLAGQICDELDVHIRLEEEIFYPAVRQAIGDEALMDEATVEHETAKDLIKQIRGMAESDDLYDARVKVLGEYIQHHVKEEHTEMFPQARSSGVDLRGLGDQMRSLKKATSGRSVGILGRMLR